MLERPEMLCKVSFVMTEATDGGLKLLVGMMETCLYGRQQ